MHHPGFIILIWAIDLFGIFIVFRLCLMVYIFVRARVVARRVGIGGWRWEAEKEVAFIYAYNLIGSIAVLLLLRFLFGAPRWLRYFGL